MKNWWLFLLLVPCVSAYTISDWPSFFVSDNVFNAVYVIGEEAPSLDVVSATVVSTSLAKFENLTTAVGTSALDSEVGDISAKDAVVIGSPCENLAAYKLMGSPVPCYKDLAGSVGYIKLYEKGSKVQLLITGLDEKDRNAAAKFLANSDLSSLDVKEFVVNSGSGSVPQFFERKYAKNESINVSEPVSNITPKNISTPVVEQKNVSVEKYGKYEP
ncbi:hypothetical protein KY319_01800, partial [Candidatus Woesearchaeota archaeon]|nr:hypothetical protein [Candidatus Woesearchaeota archaeon]